MDPVKETQDLVDALRIVQKEALDVFEATDEAAGVSLDEHGHNAIRAAANDAFNICGNLVRRLGGSPVLKAAPKPAAPEPEAPKQHAAEAALAEMEATQKRLQEKANNEPPADIADLFESDAHGMEAQRLLDLHRDITNLIMMNNATDAQRRMQERLTPHLPWLKQRRAVEVI